MRSLIAPGYVGTLAAVLVAALAVGTACAPAKGSGGNPSSTGDGGGSGGGDGGSDASTRDADAGTVPDWCTLDGFKAGLSGTQWCCSSTGIQNGICVGGPWILSHQGPSAQIDAADDWSTCAVNVNGGGSWSVLKVLDCGPNGLACCEDTLREDFCMETFPACTLPQ
jgi:hypothetical protein